MIKYLFLIISALFLVACPDPSNNDVIIPKPFADDDPSWCEKGCAHLATLPGQDGQKGCLEGRPLVHPISCTNDNDCEEGNCIENSCTESCEEICEVLIKEGRFMGPECWVTVENCEEIENKCRR